MVTEMDEQPNSLETDRKIYKDTDKESIKKDVRE